MKLSIVVIVYNLENYIEACLDSVLPQISQDVELIIVNDGSIDKSESIIHNKIIGHLNVKYLYKINGGPGSARNEGLLESKGEYVWFVDGDDEINYGSLSFLLNYINNYSFELLFFNTYHLRLNEDFKRKESFYKNQKNIKCVDFLNTYSFFPNSVWTFLFKRNLLIKNDVFFPEDILIYEDEIFLIKVFNMVLSMDVIDEPLYVYKAREGSIVKSEVSIKKVYSILTVISLTKKIKPNFLTIRFLNTKIFWYCQQFLHYSKGLELINSKYNLTEKVLFDRLGFLDFFFKDPVGVTFLKIKYNSRLLLWKSMKVWK